MDESKISRKEAIELLIEDGTVVSDHGVMVFRYGTKKYMVSSDTKYPIAQFKQTFDHKDDAVRYFLTMSYAGHEAAHMREVKMHLEEMLREVLEEVTSRATEIIAKALGNVPPPS